MPTVARNRRASSGYLLDASAVLALIGNEAGADRVRLLLSLFAITAINLAEVVKKLRERQAVQPGDAVCLAVAAWSGDRRNSRTALAEARCIIGRDNFTVHAFFPVRVFPE